jgi:hypothetical protein
MREEAEQGEHGDTGAPAGTLLDAENAQRETDERGNERQRCQPRGLLLDACADVARAVGRLRNVSSAWHGPGDELDAGEARLRVVASNGPERQQEAEGNQCKQGRREPPSARRAEPLGPCLPSSTPKSIAELDGEPPPTERLAVERVCASSNRKSIHATAGAGWLRYEPSSATFAFRSSFQLAAATTTLRSSSTRTCTTSRPSSTDGPSEAGAPRLGLRRPRRPREGQILHRNTTRSSSFRLERQLRGTAEADPPQRLAQPTVVEKTSVRFAGLPLFTATKTGTNKLPMFVRPSYSPRK